ncbi:MAG: GGDEF domain-containing protein [Lachnospiraceae bacterium]|nr:GGDEF domain-containing protein [Lachnospiraceae bacterium]
MTLAVIFTGWDSGFQISLIAITILLFFCEYVNRYLKRPYIPSFPMCLLGPASYLFSFIWIQYHPPSYLLSSDASFLFQIFWGIIVFSISCVILYTFVDLCLKSEEYLENEVGHDQLTGLPNRYFFADSLFNMEFPKKKEPEDEGGSAESPEGKSLRNNGMEKSGYWAAMVDIDDFKHINDTYGHNCGDFVLKEVARILLEWRKSCGVRTEFGFSDGRKILPDGDRMNMTIGRWGGEEFLILGQGGSGVGEMLDGLRREIMEYEIEHKTGNALVSECIHVTVTIGYAEYTSGMTVREWIGLADDRLYEGKTSGKNKVVA